VILYNNSGPYVSRYWVYVMASLERINIACAFFEFGHAFFDIVGHDDDIGFIAIGKCIHILDEDVVLSQML
jgi:hypothetical protein